MKTYPQRADVLQGYLDSGLSPVEAIQKLKTDHPEYCPKHRGDQGEPRTLEALVSDHIRNDARTPDQAVSTASRQNPLMVREYYERLRVGAVANLDDLKGHPV